MHLHLLVVSHIHPRAELGVCTARARARRPEAEEVQEPALLHGLDELALLRPQGRRVLFMLSVLHKALATIAARPTLLVPCQPMNSSLSRPNRCPTASYARLKNGRWILDLDLGFAEMGHWRIMVSQRHLVLGSGQY